MKVTTALKSHMLTLGVEATASDDEIKQAAFAALSEGKLDTAKFAELSVDPDAAKVKGEFDALKTQLAEMTTRLGKIEEGNPPAGEKRTPSTFEKMFSSAETEVSTDPLIPAVSVIKAHERYDRSRKALHFPETTRSGKRRHPFAGQRAYEGEGPQRRYLEEPSELDKAVSGAYVKMCIQGQLGKNTPRQLKMTDHDKDLMAYAMHELPWGGVIGGDCETVPGSVAVKNRKLTGMEIKALLDDSTSGGLEVAPIVFDDQIITTPLLYGEFFPRVNVVPITRGRRIEGGSMGNVSLSSGGADNTNIPLFNTANFIAAFDTNIFVVNGAIEIGLDFLSDSPVDVAGMVTQSYGLKLLEWLDEQVCIGDGSTEPEGVINASGTVSVSSANGAGGPPTVGDYEGLLFGIPKAFKKGFATDRITYGATETSYMRARAIPVGTTDARRIFGMTHEDYMLFGHPYGINESFTNQQIVFVNWARYRMYRRLGQTMRVTTEGQTLVRKNLMMISMRARYGGQIEDGNAVAYQNDAQS